MGCGNSQVFDIYEMNQDPRNNIHFQSIGLMESHINRLYQIFDKINTSESQDYVDVAELITYLNLDSSFRDTIYKIFDRYFVGQVNFEEFVFAYWNYCSFSKENIVRFAFDIYDTKNAGYLTTGEIQRAFIDLYGHRKAKKYLSKILSNSQVDPLSVKITLQDFRVICLKHPTLVIPFNDLQVIMRDHAMGVEFWDQQMRKRIESSGDDNPFSAEEYLKLHGVSSRTASKSTAYKTGMKLKQFRDLKRRPVGDVQKMSKKNTFQLKHLHDNEPYNKNEDPFDCPLKKNPTPLNDHVITGNQRLSEEKHDTSCVASRCIRLLHCS